MNALVRLKKNRFNTCQLTKFAYNISLHEKTSVLASCIMIQLTIGVHTMITDFKTKLSTRLKQLGMTQRDLAKEIGVTEATVSRYINGERLPNDELLAKLAKSLEVSVGYFKEERDNKVEDLKQISNLIARNEKRMTPEEKLAIIRLLSKD